MPRAGHGSPSTYRLPIHLSNLRHGNQPVNSRLDTSGMTLLSSQHQRRHGQNKVARAFLTRPHSEKRLHVLAGSPFGRARLPPSRELDPPAGQLGRARLLPSRWIQLSLPYPSVAPK